MNVNSLVIGGLYLLRVEGFTCDYAVELVELEDEVGDVTVREIVCGEEFKTPVDCLHGLPRGAEL